MCTCLLEIFYERREILLDQLLVNLLKTTSVMVPLFQWKSLVVYWQMYKKHNLKKSVLFFSTVVIIFCFQAMKKSGKMKFLIDGFPRNKDNLDGWQREMGDKTNVKFVLFFDCSQEVFSLSFIGIMLNIFFKLIYLVFILIKRLV